MYEYYFTSCKRSKHKHTHIQKEYTNKQRTATYRKRRKRSKWNNSTNSLSPYIRSSGYQTDVYTRLELSAMNKKECFTIMKTQNFDYEPDTFVTDPAECTSEFTNHAANEMRLTLADFFPLQSSPYEDILNDDMLQIAMQLSLKESAQKPAAVRRTKSVKRIIDKGSFKKYWNELKNNRNQKKIFKKSCNKLLRVSKIKIVFDQQPLPFKEVFQSDELKSFIPSKAQIYKLLAPNGDMDVKFESVLSEFMAHQFMSYGCHNNFKNVQIMFTNRLQPQYAMYNPKVISFPPNQEILIFGVARSCNSTLRGLPDVIVSMISCFYNMDESKAYKFNQRNAPWEPIVCYQDPGDVNDLKETRQIFVCLVNAQQSLEPKFDYWGRRCKLSVFVTRQCQMLPLYHVKYLETQCFRNKFYSWRRNQQSKRFSNQQLMKFVPRYGPNSFNPHRRIQRKWSAYYKLNE